MVGSERLGARCAASYVRSKEFDTRNLSTLLWPLLNNVLAGECYCRATATGGNGGNMPPSWSAGPGLVGERDMTESRHGNQSASPPHLLKTWPAAVKVRSTFNACDLSVM